MIDDAFNKTAEYYDDWIKKALPCYEDLFSVAIESIPFSQEEELDILDLGAGTGLFSWLIFQRYRKANYTLIDVAEKMMTVAENRFSYFGPRFSYIIRDYREALPKSQSDLIVSSLSIHHLNDDEKQNLFRKIYLNLKSGGAFINVDQIKGPSDYFQELYWSTWLKKVRQDGVNEQKIQDSIQRRKEFDRDATMTDQLNWLRSAGFGKVDCLYHHYFVGVFFAQK